MAGASVRLFNGSFSYDATANATGDYVLTGVEEGAYTLFATASRCFLFNGTATVVAGQTTVRNITMNCYG